MKAGELISQTFLLIGKVDAEQPIDGPEYKTAIFKLNNIMFSKAHLGLNYSEVIDSNDDITSPNWSWRWMTAALAKDLAPEFGRLESYAYIDEQERDGYRTVLLATQKIDPPELMSTVPRGSGNTCPGDYSSRFYSETDGGILSPTGQQLVND